MNAPTIVVLVIVAVLLALAVRSIVRSQKNDRCSGCSNEGCGGASSVDSCPVTQRAMADIEARLGPAEGRDAAKLGDAADESGSAK